MKKSNEISLSAERPTLQDVSDRLGMNPDLPEARRRDLRSAVSCFAALEGKDPKFVPLDLAVIRSVLDLKVPIQADVSRKRWYNLRSDLAAAIGASGLIPMLKTGSAGLSESWISLFERAGEPYLRHGLSRFAHWASERQISPDAVDDAVLDRFINALLEGSLVRKILDLRQTIVRSWNAIIQRVSEDGLRPITVTKRSNGPGRVAWHELPASLRQDIDCYTQWASVPDPLDDDSRSIALAPRTLDLRRDHIHSAATAAAEAGIDRSTLVNLGVLVRLEIFKRIMRHRWEREERQLTAYTHGVAGSLIAVAKEWVKVSSDELMALKAARRKLGPPPFGLTEKNKTLLRRFNDERLLRRLLTLPDKLWRNATTSLKSSRREFIELQSGLAIEVLLNIPLRMANMAALTFDRHIQWTRGPDKPTDLVFLAEETKTKVPLEFELPQELSERLWRYRNQIAPAITGKRPDVLFVTWEGRPRVQSTIALSIVQTVLKYVGVRMTPHQFRHLAAKIKLDDEPGALPLVQQLMGHKNMQTTQNFYGGNDTRRAGRAHSKLISALKRSL